MWTGYKFLLDKKNGNISETVGSGIFLNSSIYSEICLLRGMGTFNKAMSVI